MAASQYCTEDERFFKAGEARPSDVQGTVILAGWHVNTGSDRVAFVV